jgi:hypothetical protein
VVRPIITGDREENAKWGYAFANMRRAHPASSRQFRIDFGNFRRFVRGSSSAVAVVVADFRPSSSA